MTSFRISEMKARCVQVWFHSSHAFAPEENQRVRGVLYMKITDLDTEGSNVAHRVVVRG